jgi:hypothetical protein
VGRDREKDRSLVPRPRALPGEGGSDLPARRIPPEADRPAFLSRWSAVRRRAFAEQIAAETAVLNEIVEFARSRAAVQDIETIIGADNALRQLERERAEQALEEERARRSHRRRVAELSAELDVRRLEDELDSVTGKRHREKGSRAEQAVREADNREETLAALNELFNSKVEEVKAAAQREGRELNPREKEAIQEIEDRRHQTLEEY